MLLKVDKLPAAGGRLAYKFLQARQFPSERVDQRETDRQAHANDLPSGHPHLLEASPCIKNCWFFQPPVPFFATTVSLSRTDPQNPDLREKPQAVPLSSPGELCPGSAPALVLCRGRAGSMWASHGDSPGAGSCDKRLLGPQLCRQRPRGASVHIQRAGGSLCPQAFT